MTTKHKVPVVLHDPLDPRPATLRKAVEAIYVRPLKGSITHTMHKCWNILIFHAAEQNKEAIRDVYSITISTLSSNLRRGNRNLEHLRETLRRLSGTQVEWNTISDESAGLDATSTQIDEMGVESVTEWGISTMLAGAKIRSNGELEYSFAPQIKDRLLSPNVYARIDLLTQAKFSSRHSHVLYEACVRFKNNPSKKTAVRPWTFWRDLLCGDSNKETVYTEWKYFNRDVLKRAVNEVNTVMDDIEIEPIIYKNGRTVTDLQFNITLKQQQALPLGEQNVFDPDEALVSRMLSLGMSRIDATDVCVYWVELEIIAALTMTEKRMQNKKLEALHSPAAYFKNLLEKGIAQKAVTPGKTKLSAPVAVLSEPNYHARVKPVKDYFKTLPEQDQIEMLAEFSDTLTDATQISLMRSKGLKNAAMAGIFYQWLGARNAQS